MSTPTQTKRSAPSDTVTVVQVLSWIRLTRLRLQTASECFDELGEQVLASETHQAYLYLERVYEWVSGEPARRAGVAGDGKP